MGNPVLDLGVPPGAKAEVDRVAVAWMGGFPCAVMLVAIVALMATSHEWRP